MYTLVCQRGIDLVSSWGVTLYSYLLQGGMAYQHVSLNFRIFFNIGKIRKGLYIMHWHDPV